jgi:hypothetical protein
MGLNLFIMAISTYNTTDSLCASSSPWTKDPLGVKLHEEIGTIEVMRRPIE